MIHHSNSRYKPLYIYQLSLTLAIIDHDEPLSTILGRSAVAAVIAAILHVTTVPGLDHHKKLEIGSVGSCNRKPSWLDIRTIGC